MVDLMALFATSAASKVAQDDWVDHEVEIADQAATSTTLFVLAALCSC